MRGAATQTYILVLQGAATKQIVPYGQSLFFTKLHYDPAATTVNCSYSKTLLRSRSLHILAALLNDATGEENAIVLQLAGNIGQ